MDGVVNLYVRNHIRQTRVKINLISVTDFCSAYINMCLEGANQKWTAQNQSSALTSRRGPAITSCSLWYKLACTEFPFSKIKCVISSRALRGNRQLRDCDVNREFLGKHVETPAVALTCTSQLSFVFFFGSIFDEWDIGAGALLSVRAGSLVCKAYKRLYRLFNTC